MASVEEIERRREERKSRLAEQKRAQLAIDLEALDAAEIEHGDGRVVCLELNFFEEGLPTMIIGRMPSRIEQKRYDDMSTRKGVENRLKAANMLADVCVVYPDKDHRELYEQVRERSPGVHMDLAVRLMRLAMGKRDDEEKD